MYHINAVDEVTQMEVAACVEKISERFLIPALQQMLEFFPFVILGFHLSTDNNFDPLSDNKTDPPSCLIFVLIDSFLLLTRLPQLNHDLTLFLSFRIAKWLFLLMSRARIRL